MAFTTKIDYSNNRQIKQFQLTNTQLSGTTTFGVTDNLIPENVSGDTINIDALQYIRTRGLILPNALPNIVSGGTYQLLGRDNITGKIVEVDALSGGTTGGTTNDYTTSATFNTSTGQVDFNRLLGGTYSVNLDGRYLTGFTETPNTGLEALSASGGVGHRLIGKNPSNYAPIGLYAVDFSDKYIGSNLGASGIFSFAQGEDVKAGGYGAISMGAILNTTAIVGFSTGINHFNAGYVNTVFGVGQSVTGMGCMAVGQAAELISSGTESWNNYPTKEIFVVGNGTIQDDDFAYTVLSRSNAFKVLFNGEVTAPSLTTALINAEATGRVLITKEWFQAQTITGGTTNTDDYLTTHTFNTSTGLFESTLQSGSTVSVNLDGRYSLNNHTHIGLSDDYLTGGTFNELTGDLDLNLKSGSTVTINLDDRYSLTGHTHIGLSDDYLTTHTFNTSNGLFESTLQSGSTVSVDLDGRYSLTTHTHNLSNLNNDIGFITASFLGIQKIKVTLSASQIENIGQGPVQLLPAAGVGTVINIISAVARLNFGTIPFDDNTLDIADGSFGTATPGGFLSATSDQIERLVRNLDSGGSLLAENSAVCLLYTSDAADE